MTKALSRLLEHPEDIITKAIMRLEEMNGYPSHDVRASADSIAQIRTKVSELGLDPDDTTAGELYHSLLVKFENDARRFDEHFGVYRAGYDQKIKLAVELVSKNSDLPERWVLKPTAAKNLLRQHPPKQLMKLARYRSIESFIKREELAEIYLAVEFAESSAWNKAHFKLASKLETTSFEMRKLKMQAVSESWGIQRTKDVYAASSDYGALGLIPSRQLRDSSLLTLVVLLLDEIAAKPSEAARLSPAAAWWAGADRLLVSFDGRPVSLNLKDIAFSYQNSLDTENRECSAAQRHFWKDLISRYQNQLPAEEDILAKLETPIINIKTPLNQPALEYAEDI